MGYNAIGLYYFTQTDIIIEQKDVDYLVTL